MDQDAPPAILDPVIMTLSKFYQEPLCLDPLDSDPDKKGSNLITGLCYVDQLAQSITSPFGKSER